MAEIVDSSQGYTTEEGAVSAYDITAGPSVARSIVDVFANNQEHAFRVESDEDFEQFWGRYNAAGSITVLQLQHSSNGDNPVVWSAGQKLVSAIATAQDLTTMDNMVESATRKIMQTAERNKLALIAATQAIDLDALAAALIGGMVYKGNWDASAGTFPGGGAAAAGWLYNVTVAGSVDGQAFDIGDNLVAIQENASAGTFAGNWNKHDQTDAVQSVAGLVGAITDVALRTALGLGAAALLEVGTVAGTVAAGDDARLVGVDFGGLDPAGPITGSEVFAALQTGNGVGPTSEELLGNPAVHCLGHVRNRLRFFSHLTATPQVYANAVTNTLFGAEALEVWRSGAGAEVAQGSTSLLRFGAASCKTGTTDTGYAAITSTLAPIYFIAAVTQLKAAFVVHLANAPTIAEEFTGQVGLFTVPTAVATHGIFFRASLANANWQAVTKNAGGETVSDTGIPRTVTWEAFEIGFDPVSGEASFHVDGVEVVPAHTTNLPGFIVLYYGAAIFKAAGVTSRSLDLDACNIDHFDSSSVVAGTYL